MRRAGVYGVEGVVVRGEISDVRGSPFEAPQRLRSRREGLEPQPVFAKGVELAKLLLPIGLADEQLEVLQRGGDRWIAQRGAGRCYHSCLAALSSSLSLATFQQ